MRPLRSLPTTPLEDFLATISAGGDWDRVAEPAHRASGGSGLRRTVAVRPPTRMVVFEIAPAREFPLYQERRRLRQLLDTGSGDIVVFTDAAHAKLVLTRHFRTATRELLYEECFVNDDVPAAVDLVGTPTVREPGRATRTRSQGAGYVRSEIRSRVEQFLPRASVRAGETSGLCDRISAVRDVESLRRLLKLLPRVIVLDPTCRGGGDWLLGAADTLEAIWLAIRNRAHSALIDRQLGGQRRRPEFLSDLERVVADARSRPIGSSCVPNRLRCGILQRQLFGIAPTPTIARRVRASLAHWAGWGASGVVALDANVRTVPKPSKPHLVDPTHLSMVVGMNTEIGAALETLGSAWRLVVDQRLAGGESIDEWRMAAARLERRRRHLDAQWRRSVAHTGESLPPLNLLFPPLMYGQGNIPVVRCGDA